MNSVDRHEHMLVDMFPMQTMEHVIPNEWYKGGFLPGVARSFFHHAVKRSMDIAGSCIGLGLLLLLLPAIAICIFLEDKGPIFYRQTRIGQYGKTFTMYKIRSMVVDADQRLLHDAELALAWSKSGKLQRDPRVTRVGAFLRRTSIDELPQMWNVLCGDMSLVGPRAIQSSEIAIFGELYALRQMVKPGITGLWQISGRSTTDYRQRCLLDCTYVIDVSLHMDLYIILKTLPNVLYGNGAY